MMGDCVRVRVRRVVGSINGNGERRSDNPRIDMSRRHPSAQRWRDSKGRAPVGAQEVDLIDHHQPHLAHIAVMFGGLGLGLGVELDLGWVWDGVWDRFGVGVGGWMRKGIGKDDTPCN